MNEALIRRAALVLDPAHPLNHGAFDGTFDEAVDAIVAYARAAEVDDGPHAQHRLTEVLRHSDPNRVAEVCAGALLRLAGEVR
jgi:hypothetical protein